VRSDAELVQQRHDPRGAQQVDLHGAVEWRVEGDRGRRVDDDVARGERGPIVLAEPEAVGADVAGDGAHAPRGHLLEALAAELGPQPVERVVPEDLPLHPPLRRGPPAGADQEHELAVRHLAQQPLDECGADEAGGAGDGDALAGQRVGDGLRRPSVAAVAARVAGSHGTLSTIW
jgi:hypothetical protein